MRKGTMLLTTMAVVAVVASGSILAAPRVERHPPRFAPGSLDGVPVSAIRAADGLEVGAWAYRIGAEYDIAISFRDASALWSEPQFIGRYDGVDQVRPAVTFDDAGHLYLAFVAAPSGRAFVAVRSASTLLWSTPFEVTPPAFRVQSVGLRVVADRLVVALANVREVRLTEIDLLVDSFQPQGISDGPDPVGSSGEEHADGKEESDQQQEIAPPDDATVVPIAPGNRGGSSND